MDVGKDLSVVADEGRVSSHAHVIFQVTGGIAVAVFNAETEPCRLIGLERSGISFPDHPISVGELRNIPTRGQLRTPGIVSGQRSSGRARRNARRGRQINLSHLGLWEAGFMYDVRVNLVMTGGHAGQVG